jgi:hypothetical protein
VRDLHAVRRAAFLKVVEGDISPNGWCKSYAMAD